MIEQIRQEFEEWYEKQGLDPHAKWHPAETLEYMQDKYPNGRYTIMSGKQHAWEIWQAAFACRLEGHVIAPLEATQEMLDAACPPAPKWQSSKLGIQVREAANEERRQEYRNIVTYLKGQENAATQS